MNIASADLARRAHHLFIEPHSNTVDGRRREFVLNTLLAGCLVISIVAFISALTDYALLHVSTHISSVLQTLVFGLAISALLCVSRRGRPGVASYVFVGFLLLSAINFTVSWGFGLASAELLFALTIVISGVLFTAPIALLTTAAAAILLLVIAYLQSHGIQHPVTDWEHQPFIIADAVGYIAVFMVIGLVSWLSNRETDRALHRAQASEAALQKERDNLETKVIARTHELEDLQLARLLEMQPFAEFGRIGASLVHEIANPLTAATLQLQALDKEQHSELVQQVQRSLHQLERYLLAARKQIKRESWLTTFSVRTELRQVVNLSANRARRANVVVQSTVTGNMKLFGDAVKFNQLVANLLANAIDASASDLPEPATIVLRASQKDTCVVIEVIDHGIGISKQAMAHLFEPFYSTKKTVRSGLGIGLTMVKQYTEHDFRGSIEVASSPSVGTVFTVRLRGQEPA